MASATRQFTYTEPLVGLTVIHLCADLEVMPGSTLKLSVHDVPVSISFSPDGCSVTITGDTCVKEDVTDSALTIKVQPPKKAPAGLRMRLVPLEELGELFSDEDLASVLAGASIGGLQFGGMFGPRTGPFGDPLADGPYPGH